MPVTDRNMVKHRVQLGLTSSATDHKQEIDRLLALGARQAAMGRPALILARPGDPEGNELYVVRPKETLIR